MDYVKLNLIDFKELIQLIDSYVRFGETPESLDELIDYLKYLELNEPELCSIIETKIEGSI